MTHLCGCEIGGDCTKTTMCYVQIVEQDLNDEIEILEEKLKEYTDAEPLHNTHAG